MFSAELNIEIEKYDDSIEDLKEALKIKEQILYNNLDIINADQLENKINNFHNVFNRDK